MSSQPESDSHEAGISVLPLVFEATEVTTTTTTRLYRAWGEEFAVDGHSEDRTEADLGKVRARDLPVEAIEKIDVAFADAKTELSYHKMIRRYQRYMTWFACAALTGIDGYAILDLVAPTGVRIFFGSVAIAATAGLALNERVLRRQRPEYLKRLGELSTRYNNLVQMKQALPGDAEGDS